MNAQLLEEIGLTPSEIQVYLALLELGSTTAGPLIKKAGIASSKIYEVMDKLIEKGLASYIYKNKVKYFIAAPPSRIQDYLQEKKQKINEQEKEFTKLLPLLEEKQSYKEEGIDAEIYIGWRGIETVFEDMLNTLKEGDTDYVFGASKGFDPEKTRRFFSKYQTKAYEKGIKVKAIFNEDSRGYYKKSKSIKKHIEDRYLDQTTPAEINVCSDKVIILIFSRLPLSILIRGKEIASSFKQYFDVMWRIAKK